MGRRACTEQGPCGVRRRYHLTTYSEQSEKRESLVRPVVYAVASERDSAGRGGQLRLLKEEEMNNEVHGQE